MSDTAQQLRTRSSHQDPYTDASLDSELMQVFDALPDGVLLMDRDFRITYANQTARRISRIRPEDISSKSHWELYPDTLGTTIEDAYRGVMNTRVERELEPFYYKPFDIWYQIRVTPTQNGIALYYRDVTEKRQAEEERRETAERLRLALTATNGVGIWDWDVVNDCVYADARFAKIYGVAPIRAINGVPLVEFTRNIHPEDSPTVGAAIQTCIRDGGEFISQYRIRQSDGSIVWVSARGRCTYDEFGKAVRFSGVIIDITDQKHGEHALRESETRYRVLTELSPQSQWAASAEGLIVYANQRFLEYIGRDFVPETGSEYLTCFDPRDHARVTEVWTHSIATGEDYSIDARLIRGRDGASRWWHIHALPVRDEAGKITQWLGSANDIHEERVAADLLREQYSEIDRQRRELETIYAGSPIGMALYEPNELRLVRINARQAEIFRLPVAEAIGKRYEDLTLGVPIAHDLIRRAAAGETIVNREIEGSIDRRPDEYRYWNINFSPIFNEDGSVRSIASATIEVTHQKRAELALIQSEKLAAVGRMASSIAHEINNPLESVTNLLYIARQQTLNTEALQFLDLADQELRRVAIIANQTLRFHRQSSYPREVTCDALYATVLSIFEGRLRNSTIVVNKRKRANLPICCFEGDIRQVLNNLVGNAIDAMATGGTLYVRSRECTDWRTGRKGIALTVADTGGGMSPETVAHVFEAFFTTKGINGTGLGLWISSEIVERHNGRLLLRTAPTRGTVFSLFLPFDTLLTAPAVGSK
jgi:PAS domain S-box-containing protein